LVILQFPITSASFLSTPAGMFGASMAKLSQMDTEII